MKIFPLWLASIGNVPLTLKPLVSKHDQRQGYMGQTVPPKDTEGYLFVHEEPCRQSYWMKDVPFDLDCLGFDGNSRLVEVLELKAHATASRSFMRAVQHVVEVRGGWCRSKGVHKGARLVCENLLTETMSSNIKLGPILFTEAAKTATEALGEGLVAVVSADGNRAVEVVLLNRQAAEENLDNIVRLQDRATAQAKSMIMDSKEAVLGFITANLVGPKLWKVEYSAAVHGHGPLLYQLVMTLIGGGWLKASETLTDDSANIWNKMYEFTWTGLYVKKFVGEFAEGERLVEEAFGVLPRLQYGSPGSFANFQSRLTNPSKDSVKEESVLRWIEQQGLEPEEIGNLWAYRLESPDPAARKLVATGKKFLTLVPKEFGIASSDALDVIFQAGARFFGRMYR